MVNNFSNNNIENCVKMEKKNKYTHLYKRSMEHFQNEFKISFRK